MNENTCKPRYFRLLEKGETIKEGDVWRKTMESTYCAGLKHSIDSDDPLRPVQVDEWQNYAERKPTKEDFEPTGTIDAFQLNGSFCEGLAWSNSDQFGNRNVLGIEFWRRITPPQPAKPKSVGVDLCDSQGTPIRHLTVHADGQVSLPCGDNYSAESIKEFMTAYQEITGTKPH